MAQFLISTVNHLSPKSGTVLTPGKHYTGAQYFFGQGVKKKNKHTRSVEKDEIADPSIMPKSLRDALRIFIIGVAIGLKEKLVPLGGIRYNNLSLLYLVRSNSFAILSEIKKKPAIIRRLF